MFGDGRADYKPSDRDEFVLFASKGLLVHLFCFNKLIDAE